MVSWILSQPFWLAAICLMVVAGVRSQCTYWLGRAVRSGLLRGRWASRVNSDRVQTATRRLERWGWPLIPVSFLTVGFQTGVHLACGVVGWRWLSYTMASVPGWIIWGVVYSAGGLAIFAGAVALLTTSPWLVVGVVAVLAACIVVVTRHRRVKRLDTMG